MAVPKSWTYLEGQTIDEDLRLEKFIPGAGRPIFEAKLLTGATEHSVIVSFWPAGDSADTLLDRHREAQFLSHPNLSRCLRSGSVTIAGGEHVYAACEAYDALLIDYLRDGPRTAAEVRDLGLQLVSALAYLHEQNLVYCNLQASTVARSGDLWKLCDYSQLRVPGAGYARETRKLLPSLPGAPPEAYEGIVTLAWDTW